MSSSNGAKTVLAELVACGVSSSTSYAATRMSGGGSPGLGALFAVRGRSFKIVPLTNPSGLPRFASTKIPHLEA